jgi:hypothetical protein
MTIGHITKMLNPLLEDAGEAENYLDKNIGSMFARRIYVRSFFSCIEGIVWVLKEVCLHATTPSGKRQFHIAEYALLKEHSYELKNNGDIKVSAKFLRLPDNIRFVFKLLSRHLQIDLSIDASSKNWSYFLKALDIRNRLTHPKGSNPFHITDEELDLCKKANEWFVDLVARTIQSLVKVSSTINQIKPSQ